MWKNDSVFRTFIFIQFSSWGGLRLSKGKKNGKKLHIALVRAQKTVNLQVKLPLEDNSVN